MSQVLGGYQVGWYGIPFKDLPHCQRLGREVAADDLVADDQPPDASGVPFAQALPHLEEQHALGTAEFHAACEANLGE